MKKEVVNVGELIAGIVATHEAFVADSGLTLKYEMEQGVRVLGDADMIRQGNRPTSSRTRFVTRPKGAWLPCA